MCRLILIIAVVIYALPGTRMAWGCSTVIDALDRFKTLAEPFETLRAEHPERITDSEFYYFMNKQKIMLNRLFIAMHHDDDQGACKAEADYEVEMTKWLKPILAR
jgi:hypothetical protein